MAIFIKKLIIKNYKCFEDEIIELNVPDGNPGSGLNILIGENGNGKTTILESLNYLTQDKFSSQNRLKINDFYDDVQEIRITGETEIFNCKMPYPGNYFESKGFEFIAKNRGQKSPGRLLSTPFQTNNYFLNINENYKNSKSEDSGKPIIELYKGFNNENIIEDEINVFYFDKNRTRQITSGNYKTTFEKICDDLNWKFVKELNKDVIKKGTIIKNVCSEYFENVINIAQKGTGKKIANSLKDFFDNEAYKNIKIEILDLLHPFSNSFFALRNESDLKQINTKDLGSGVEMILALLLLQNIAGESKGNIIYLIDEPELHLHPKAQDKLLNLFLEESKNKQIIISTHSPYLYKNAVCGNANFLSFSRNTDNKIIISNIKNTEWGWLPGGNPSWGEVNYFVYGMPTIEFHDELYGHLHEKFIASASDQADADTKGKQTVFEKDYLQTKINTTKKWTPEFGGIAKTEENVTLPTFIRNKIHHPENATMKSANYSPEELKDSIEKLIGIVKTLS